VIAIGASNFDGFNHVFFLVATAVDCGKGAEATLVRVHLMARQTYGMSHCALRNRNNKSIYTSISKCANNFT
jgi:hypothetical protein